MVDGSTIRAIIGVADDEIFGYTSWRRVVEANPEERNRMVQRAVECMGVQTVRLIRFIWRTAEPVGWIGATVEKLERLN
jgi:16S rRNA U516 pseudouridylate synthase RsuA-like enzyme